MILIIQSYFNHRHESDGKLWSYAW